MSFKMEFLVDYIDTDAMGVVHHASYFRWFERCRVEWLRSIGLSYRQMETEGYILPLREARIAYKKPLVFDDKAVIEVSVERLRSAGVDLSYTITLNGEVRTTGFTSHVVCKKTGEDSWSPCRIPEKWRSVWQAQTEKKS